MDSNAQEIFLQALELEPQDRKAFLDEACGDDWTLRSEVESLLEISERADLFFASAEGSTVNPHAHRKGYPEQKGNQIGPYILRQRIGEGGFGIVWMAEQIRPIRRMVALKVIKAGMDTKEVLSRFEAERQALSMMEHPNIARVFDAGETEHGRPYFAMELVKGIPITRFCDDWKMDTRQRLLLFSNLCSAISHAHQKGIIHRDIKPSNVLVTLDGEKPVVKVIDFGIAKAIQGKLTDQTLFTRFEQLVGTPVYMSPEQAAISASDVDTRSDIYSLGVLLYEILTGKTPFDRNLLLSAGYEEMRRIIREVDPEKPSSRLSTILADERSFIAVARSVAPEKLEQLVAPDLDWIIMKALEKDRERRYETADSFDEDIANFLNDRAVQARPPSRRYLVHKFMRRHRTACIFVTLFVALLIISIASTTWVTRMLIISEDAMRPSGNVSAGIPTPPPEPAHLTDLIDLNTAKCLLDDHFDPPESSQFYWAGSHMFENGLLVLKGKQSGAWGNTGMAYRDFACEVVARARVDGHRGWGMVIMGTRVGQPDSPDFRNGIEVLLDTQGKLSIVPCRWVRQDQLDIDPIKDIPVPWFKPNDFNALTAVFTNENTVRVFVNGIEAYDSIPLPYRLDPALLQIASIGGITDSTILEFQSFRVFSLSDKP